MARKRPVVFVIGCTGTGKSDLGIAIAKKYDGEVISVDSQQLYKGLDIATNKVKLEEMSGIPHHLMSFLEPSEEYNVHLFREQCTGLMEDIFSRGRIPIIVGGTTYYAESVLFNNTLIGHENTESSKISSEFDEMSPEQLYNLLKEVDPDSAAILHPNNTFRVRRAVEIFKLTGIRKSDHLKKHNSTSKEILRYTDTLILSLDASLSVLDSRLNSRVDKMRNGGLRQELIDFYQTHDSVLNDLTHGIMQCIGLKEFMPFLRLTEEQRNSQVGDKLFEEGLEGVKLHTRQYSRAQRSWVNNRLIGRKNERMLPSIKKMDTSDPYTYIDNGLVLVDRWMNGEEFSEESSSNMQSIEDANKTYECDVCNILVTGTNCWNLHLNGKKHKGTLRSLKRRKENQLQTDNS